MIDKLPSDDPQQLIDSYFHQEAAFWEEIYNGTGVLELLHQERLRVILDFEAKFAKPHTCCALDIGCGAGLASVALARRGYIVHAVDSVLEMVEVTRKRAAREGLESRIKCARGDIRRLEFANDTFDVIIAAGVLPWLQSTEAALQEMSRVLKPGGRLIVSADNRWGLCWFLDPLTNPLLRPLKERVRSAVERLRARTPRARVQMTSIRECHRLLRANGLRMLDETTLGFGPFSLFRRDVLPCGAGLRLYRLLQTLADRGYPPLRWAGAQYVVAAEKSAPFPR
ncbi:MAG TPA: class I SAM-dependent methyltransferase [Candidatus Binataceae bacterium]